MNMEKSDFVEFSLFPLLNRIDETIVKAEYTEENGEEYVYVRYNGGYAMKICVSADSLAALSRDVLKRI